MNLSEEETLKSKLISYGINVKKINKIAESSNKVYLIKTDVGSKVVKTSIFGSERSLSPFWNQLQNVFGLTTELKFIQQAELVKIISLLAPFTIPKVERVGEFFVMDYLEGSPIEEDEFPESNVVEEQLGRYLRNIHNLNYDGFGNLINALQDKSLFLDKLVNAMRETIRTFWKDDVKLNNLLDLAIRDFRISNKFSLIMPDISANQFVYTSTSPQSIAGLVDLDSYVVGPIEMELVVLEYVILRNNGFLETYSYEPHMLDNSRMLFRLYMYLCDPEQEKTWEEFHLQSTFETKN